MHLAHVTGWGHAELMGMAVAELAYWCGEALDYWAQINTAGD